MKKIVFVVSVLINSWLNAQTIQWARSGGEIERDAGRAVCSDKDGNIIVAGYFSGKVFFDTLYQGRGTDDAFLVKFSKEGDLIWVITIGGPREDAAMGVDTDKEGNIYVTGEFDSLMILENKVLFSAGGKDIFLAKYNSNGQLIWAQRAGGTGYDSGNAISVDKNGSAYITGKFENFASFGTQVITSNGFFDIFFAKYDTDGNLLWLKKAGGVKEDVGLGIATDTLGNCYATGYFNETVDFEASILSTPSVSSEIFILKIDSVAEYDWVHQAGGLRGDVGYSIDVDFDRNSYITGYFTDIAYFGNNSVTAVSYNDIFVAKYSPKGLNLWAKSAGGRLLDIGTGVAVAKDGSVFVTGVIDSVVYFETDTIFLSRKDDVFIAKWDKNGNYKWVKTAGGVNSQIGLAICTGNDKDVYITGYFYSQIDFGDTIIYQPNDADIFVAKLNDPLLSDEVIKKQTIAVNVYPNPVNDLTRIESDDFLNKVIELSITDIAGKVFLETKHQLMNINAIDLDISMLNEGIYFIRIESESFTFVQRVIIR
jgi:hypothetical protein